jgi:transposase
MPQRNDLSRSDTPLEQQSTLIAVVEMSRSSWLVAGIVPGLERHPLKKLAPDEEALLRLLHRWRDEAARAGRAVTRVAVAFEAGRDGFWLARWLRARDVEAHVIHPTSVAVSREHRRAKTDRLDTELLKRAFLGWLRGEPEHCSMAAIPTLEEEDARRPNREREGLVGERTRIVNRIKGALARLGIRGFKPTLRNAAERLETVRTPEGAPLPPNTLAELRRDMARLRLVRDQIRQVEEARLEALERQPATGRDAMLRLLARVVGVGVETADMLVHEILSRGLRDRRAVARYAGLTGSPDESGSRRREKGLARSGNARVRRGMIQLAWRFLLHQKGQRARPLVPGAHRGRPRRHAQDADRGAGAEAPGRAVAAGDHGQGAGGPRPAAGVTGRIGQPHGKGFRRSATPPWRAADDGPRWR